MALTTSNMGLKVWNLLTDYFNHTELQANFELIDTHDHTTGNGVPLPEGALAPDSVNVDNIKDNSITTNKLVNGSVTAKKLASTIITATNIANDTVTKDKMANDAVGHEELDAPVMEDLGLTEASSKRRGVYIRAGSDSVTNGAYTYLTNADRITNIVVPTDGLLHISYQAMWQKQTTGPEAAAAIFIGASQVRQSAVPNNTLQEATIPAGGSIDWKLLKTTPDGLTSINTNGVYGGDSTTGQILPFLTAFVTAGTYDVGVKFKATSSGTVAAQGRRLYVWTQGF